MNAAKCTCSVTHLPTSRIHMHNIATSSCSRSSISIQLHPNYSTTFHTSGAERCTCLRNPAHSSPWVAYPTYHKENPRILYVLALHPKIEHVEVRPSTSVHLPWNAPHFEIDSSIIKFVVLSSNFTPQWISNSYVTIYHSPPPTDLTCSPLLWLQYLHYALH